MLSYYPFRWLYASISGLLLFAIGMYSDLYPTCSQLIVAKHTESRLLFAVMHLRLPLPHLPFQQKPSQTNGLQTNGLQTNGPKVNHLPNTANGPYPQVNALIELLQQYWLTIQTMEVMLTGEAGNVLQAQLMVKGAYPQWLAFLAGLEQDNNPVFVENVDITRPPMPRNGGLWASPQVERTAASHEEGPLLIRMTIQWLKGTVVDKAASNQRKPRPALGLLEGPFCLRGRSLEHSQPTITSLPLQHLKMVGFMQQGQKKQALLASPDHGLWAVGVGAIVGLERAKVTAVTEHGVDALLTNGASWRTAL